VAINKEAASAGNNSVSYAFIYKINKLSVRAAIES
jgi:hypothetical protein